MENVFGIKKTLIQKIIGLEDLKENEPIYFFTGKGFSGDSFHLGHWFLQKIIVQACQNLKAPLLIQLSGEEKKYTSPIKSTKQIEKYIVYLKIFEEVNYFII